jgi:hypothetical protein
LLGTKLPAHLSKRYRSAFTAVRSACNMTQLNFSVTIFSETLLQCEDLTWRNCLLWHHSTVRFRFISVSEESAASFIKVASHFSLKRKYHKHLKCWQSCMVYRTSLY